MTSVGIRLLLPFPFYVSVSVVRHYRLCISDIFVGDSHNIDVTQLRDM